MMRAAVTATPHPTTPEASSTPKRGDAEMDQITEPEHEPRTPETAPPRTPEQTSLEALPSNDGDHDVGHTGGLDGTASPICAVPKPTTQTEDPQNEDSDVEIEDSDEIEQLREVNETLQAALGAKKEGMRCAALMHMAELRTLKQGCKELSDDVRAHMQMCMADFQTLGNCLMSTIESAQNEIKVQVQEAESRAATAETLIQEKEDQKMQTAAELEKTQAEVQSAEHKYAKELVERRKLMNEVQDMRGNIRVFVRVRPLLNKEVLAQETTVVNCASEERLEIAVEQAGLTGETAKIQKGFNYDRVFGPGSKQVSPPFSRLHCHNTERVALTGRSVPRNGTPCAGRVGRVPYMHLCVWTNWFWQNVQHGRR
jgi:hypothetical protein